MNKISPCIWFNSEGEDAAKFYTATFPNSKIIHIEPYIVDTPSNKPLGSTMTVTFYIDGTEFMALNGGEYFKPNPSVSFHYKCKSKEELTKIWEKLSEGGRVLMPLDKYPFSELYGWIEDKYGVSWQLIIVKDVTQYNRITPVLMFVNNVYGKAEEAAKLYTSVFKNSTMGDLLRYGKDNHPDDPDAIMYCSFTLNGQEFGAMDSAREHEFNFTEGVSLIIPCENQEEIDYYYEKLSADPEAEVCGWLKDKFGVSWQLITKDFDEMMNSMDEEKKKRVMLALLDMKRIDIDKLKSLS